MLKLLISLLILIHTYCLGQFAGMENSFTRPWANAKGELNYENISLFFQLFDEAASNDSLPMSIKIRQQTECGLEEIEQCGDREACWINRIPDDPFNLKTAVIVTNRAHYRCKCNADLPLIDYIRTEENQTSRVIHTKCPNIPACEKCDMRHTINCIDHGDGEATCVCDPDYMENTNCVRKKDGCLEHHPAATLTGKQACMDDGRTNNTCYPIPQSLKYYCVCRHPYREDKRLSFPNCMDNRTLCEKPMCLGFQPPPTDRVPGPSILLDPSYEDGNVNDSNCNVTFCDCPDGWMGRHCTEKRGEPILGSWSPWSTCSPDCIMPNERSRYKRSEDLHAGTSHATPIGYRSKFSRCTLNDPDYCVGTYRLWRRCRVTTLCNAWTNERLSTVVNEAIGQAMIEHDKAHQTDHVEPITTTAAQLTWSERHALNFITVAGAFILSGVSIWIMEIHHLFLHMYRREL